MNKILKGLVILIALAILVVIGVLVFKKPGSIHTLDSEKAVVSSQVEAFGAELQNVSLLAPADVLSSSMDQHYSQYVTVERLEAWKQNPAEALGREASSPYPDRIEIKEVSKLNDGFYFVSGDVIESTSSEDAVAKYPIELNLVLQNGVWKISGGGRVEY